jgi:hypothetical protein
MKLLTFVIAVWLAMASLVATQISIPSSASQPIIPTSTTVVFLNEGINYSADLSETFLEDDATQSVPEPDRKQETLPSLQNTQSLEEALSKADRRLESGMQKIMGNFLKAMQETTAAMDKTMGPELGARFRKNLAQNMAQGFANSMADKIQKTGLVRSEDLGSMKKDLAEKMKRLALETEGALAALGGGEGEAVTGEKGSKRKAKRSKVKAKELNNFKKKDELQDA